VQVLTNQVHVEHIAQHHQRHCGQVVRAHGAIVLQAQPWQDSSSRSSTVSATVG
jgi:hypothetical protein